mmetsp:Transcript_29642/g.81133  ORF Transcript_29642/g.81133 Transcript_29642/m.81133 type:complete len:128 (+) Transcript_29642:308-691(+)
MYRTSRRNRRCQAADPLMAMGFSDLMVAGATDRGRSSGTKTWTARRTEPGCEAGTRPPPAPAPIRAKPATAIEDEIAMAVGAKTAAEAAMAVEAAAAVEATVAEEEVAYGCRTIEGGNRVSASAACG